MAVVEAVFLLVGGMLAILLFAYGISYMYITYKKKTIRYLSEDKQARMQENIVSGILLIIVIILATWLCVMRPQ